MKKAQFWASSFSTVSIFDSNGYIDNYSEFSMAIAVGKREYYKSFSQNGLPGLQVFLNKHSDEFIAGHLGYNLMGNNVKKTPSIFFYVPEVLIKVHGNEVHISSDEGNTAKIYETILKLKIPETTFSFKGKIKPRITRKQYGDAFKKIQKHLSKGDVYALNLCQEFYAENVEIDPFDAYQKLNRLSPNPFSCFFKSGNQSILSASPERFLGKRGNIVFSQPIKGTAARGKTPQEDLENSNQLKTNPKDIRENVMIVDLVRSDLTQIAEKASVKVDELLGLYTFPQVHQLISTVSCTLNSKHNFSDIISKTFPPGSMTGVPKKKAIQLIEDVEATDRGVYSGALGYISPTGDFDFNVIIRSIIYDAKNKHLSYHVGGAITSLSNEEEEYEECLIKASAIERCLE